MGKTNTNNTKAVRNRKRKEEKQDKDGKRFLNNIESRKQHIKSLSNQQLTDKQIILISRGLKFIPTPMTGENLIRCQLLTDFNQFARQMHLQYIYRGERNKPHPFHVKSNWTPPVQPSVGSETFLEEVKFELAGIELHRPKDNLSHNERRALRELPRDKNIVLKKTDKGTTTIAMNREDKIKEGQLQLNDRNNYRPLDKPMVETIAKKADALVKKCYKKATLTK